MFQVLGAIDSEYGTPSVRKEQAARRPKPMCLDPFEIPYSFSDDVNPRKTVNHRPSESNMSDSNARSSNRGDSNRDDSN